MISVELSNRQDDLHFDASQLTSRLADLLAEEGYASGELSVSVVGETEMHALNRQFLDHDYHTDVLSFVLERDDNRLQGEIIASAAMAIERCDEFGWSANDELSLYLIHGALHLAGYDDKHPSDRERMRERENHYLKRFDIAGVRDDNSTDVSSGHSEQEA